MEMITLFNARFGFQHEKDVLRSRYKNLRKQYNDIKILLDQAGFAWDEFRQMIIADDDTWDAYVKAHPDARSFRTRTFPDYNNLGVIYGNASVNAESINVTTEKPDQNDYEVPSTSDRSRTFWTLSMDRYFVDLMLEQVREGNKIDNTFDRKAWVHMTTLFNAKFGSQYDKAVLKSRYKSLRKQYNYIDNLLNQSGFGLDEQRRMVTADDDIWDSHVKAHPDAQSYRTKILSNFNDLCVIYGNGTPGRRGGQSDYHVYIDSDVMGMDTDGVSSSPQLSAVGKNFVDNLESAPHSSSDTILHKNQKKRRSARFLNSHHSKRLQMIVKTGKLTTVSGVKEVITSIENIDVESGSSISIETVMGALQAVPDIDEELLLDACDLLEDEKKSKTFLALEAKLNSL